MSHSISLVVRDNSGSDPWAICCFRYFQDNDEARERVGRASGQFETSARIDRVGVRQSSVASAAGWEFASVRVFEMLAKCSPDLEVNGGEPLKDALAYLVSSAFSAIDEGDRFTVSIDCVGFVSVSKIDQTGVFAEKRLGSVSGRRLPDLKADMFVPISGADDMSVVIEAPLSAEADEPGQNGLAGVRVVAAILGFCFAFFVEVIVLQILGDAMGARIVPRGLGWIGLPVLFGVFCWHAVPHSRVAIQTILDGGLSWVSGQPAFVRWCLAGVIVWLAAVVTFNVVAEPYGGYLSEEDRSQLIKIVILPPFVGVVVAWVVLKLVREK